MADSNLCIISYNSRGFNASKRDFLHNLSRVAGCHTIIFNQENFLLKNNGYIARKVLPDHHVILNPATKDDLEGRPKNGMFIAVPKCLKEKVKEVPVKSKRIQSIRVTLEDRTFLLINSYFPTDPRVDFDENNLLLLLSEIEDIIETSTFDHFVLGGDINADFTRNTKFVRIIEEFINKIGVCRSWNEYPVEFTHFMERDGITHISTIDHFYRNDMFTEQIVDAGALHLIENQSDHCPIFCKFKLPMDTKEETNKNTKNKRFIPSWKNAKEIEKENFFNELTERLDELLIPVHATRCHDVHCNNPSHKDDLDDFMKKTLEMVETVASETLSRNEGTGKSHGKQNKRLPNWKEDVDPVKENAHFWNSVWKSAGKPINCQLHTIMKMTRNKYHLAIRKKKRLIERMKRDNMLNSCLAKDGDIFKEIKEKRNCKQTFSTTIDGHTKDIPAYLANKYEKLYNGVDDKENLKQLEEDLNGKIDEESMEFVNLITEATVKMVTQKKLKASKTDATTTITSDLLIHAPDKLFKILAICFRGYIVHAHVSKFLLISTMVPIIKDKMGDITSSNNYRSIAISSLIMKIFDLVILSTFGEYLQLDDLQFSYQAEVSTSMCTWLAVESISYFLRNGSEVFTCLMDMSKAFDTVQHSHLFRKLLSQGLPEIIVRVILISYKHQKANVRWNGEESQFFNLGNGVKQGAILSAILYCVYTNGIFEEQRKSNMGCFIGRNYVGVLGYADDLYLMAPTIDALQGMLTICEKYAYEHNLKFSTDQSPIKSKTKCIAYLHKYRDLPKLSLCDNKLPWVDSGKHLGMRIDTINGNILTKDILEKRARYIQSNNELVQEFSYTSSDTKAFINRVYNSHAYGAVLWNLYGKEANMYYNTWSTSVRKMYRIDRTTHRFLIEPISGIPHIKCAILQRFVKFASNLSSSKKKVISNTYTRFSGDCRSTTGSNLRNVLLENDVDATKTLEKKDIKEFKATPLDQEWRISIIKELIQIRDGAMESIGWTKDDLQDTLKYLCTF